MHMVARLTKKSIPLSRYFHIVQEGKSLFFFKGQLYRYSYRQISVTIHCHIDVSNTALGVVHILEPKTLRIPPPPFPSISETAIMYHLLLSEVIS